MASGGTNAAEAGVVLSRVWSREADEVARALEVDPTLGLSGEEAAGRLERYGPNQLREIKGRSIWSIVVDQVDDLVIIFLIVTAVVSMALGFWVEGVAVAIVVLINGVLGLAMDLRARRSMQALRQLEEAWSTVVREGRPLRVGAHEVVPGDVVLLDEGDVITVDVRLVEANRVQVDEAALTGESLPVEKGVEALAASTELAERSNMLFKGTTLTRGTGRGVVVATGMATELGGISALVEGEEEGETPLEHRLNRLASRLIWVTLGLSALVVPAGVAAGKTLEEVGMTAIALAVATVPEGLPVVATLTLARGMLRMAEKNALMRRLASVETLGATTLICTDKTGTLTENRMVVRCLVLPSGEVMVEGGGEVGRLVGGGDSGAEREVGEALEVGVLCTNASIGRDGQAMGDPMEVALLRLARQQGVDVDGELERMPEVREEAFDSEVKMMATYHRLEEGRVRVAVKGAPEEVLGASTRWRCQGKEQAFDEEERGRWHRENEAMARRGLRVLALASREVEDAQAAPYEELTFVGLVGFYDPPREEVREAIRECAQAGVRVVMITGDQAATARSIALQIGLVASDEAEVIVGKELRAPEELSREERGRVRAASMFARVSPEQKLNIIALHQEAGEVVAMTGDGVNDSPALARADIGVAMGQRGTQAARETADLVLRDDRFNTIVYGIEEGRVIFTNIRRFVVFLLSINWASIVVIVAASLAGAPLPVTAMQILYLNVVTDVFPSLALVATGGASELMRRPPRSPKESILTGHHWGAIGVYGVVISAAVLVSLAVSLQVLGFALERAVTVSFLTLGFGKAFHALNMRDVSPRGGDSDAWVSPVMRNGWVWGAIVWCAVLLAMTVYVPWLRGLLETVRPGVEGWALAVGLGVVPLVVIQAGQRVVLGLRRA
ncbi:cation-transporting P-type ATPase [Lujinxingia sediminis]|uniref:Cation-transporting P-type ATPase n=1 Tax=Lujinxingia sediminis TaxID=2480984 RepID=A0ABY0CPB5_9DELT|nr:cation-transporting P-type ATPase [Lujinxingia sediminis]RVU41389.1 cation-transporting P-type ATPase [Lujinxingia sediminis]